ncbi:hypothetical protein OJF2_05160 [Aquisphaera giovannonii]|uniref:Uncharacterized protein n=1 Tax=Aquisphaera giovannonii TaxID=406548 RepID=A0A5B9VVT1_9BACT|nr:hypothetical protein OJF2_05160 [Aquisphaera giovannonii]
MDGGGPRGSYPRTDDARQPYFSFHSAFRFA